MRCVATSDLVPPEEMLGTLSLAFLSDVFLWISWLSAQFVPSASRLMAGTLGVDGANRFAVRYANATRWAPSTVVTDWSLPNGSDDPTALPLQCPQINVDPSTYSEDCLSMILYVPVDVAPDSRVPTLIHGGSFDSGSATLPGLDGSKLAIATGSIFAMIQYRLGADTINAVEFLGQVLPSFGGNPRASMSRTLLVVPSASSLFRNASSTRTPWLILTMDFYPSHSGVAAERFNDLVSCAVADTACQMALTLDEILDAQPLLLTNVKNEAGPTMYHLLFPGPDPVPAFEFQPILTVTRTSRCSSWARLYLALPGVDARAQLGRPRGLGIRRAVHRRRDGPANADIPYCLEDGVVCHGDDIQSSLAPCRIPTAAQAAVTVEMQRGTDVHPDGNPNAPGLEPWPAATTSDIHARELGIKTTPSRDDLTGACTPTF
ncbi:Alpha/Beta hydrolase protein [Mycena rosella]|uniref:Alpha/Beta hydrolase protein n=1 Tax=Mycena rosella TaxID=1033263 RepID=A0AAD7D7V6_MYCRO|nr:Alpha/Beta hydrolase protein [Mycena rosella]